VVYDVNGLRDSVKHRITGLVTKPNPEALSRGVVELLTNQNLYHRLQQNAWDWSKQITFDQSYQDFKQITEAIA
jgi:glycosyltransferase involved in cell wall biosynthesis